MSDPQRIFITGASSGSGAAVALEYAAPGVTLGLVARRAELLAEIKAKAEAKGARVFVHVADVTDRAAMQRAAEAFLAEAGGADLVYANAGVGGDGSVAGIERAADAARVIEINLLGVVNALAPFIAPMRAARSGHLAATGSVAGFAGLNAGGYSASKAGVKTWIDTLRLYLGGEGIALTTICPGFISTPMTEPHDFPMPFLIPAQKAARLIRGALDARKKTYIFPWPWRLVVPFMRRAPAWLLRRITR